MGSLDKIIELSSIVWKILNQSSYSRENWIDQAIINYVIYYKKKFANDTIIRNENKDSPILTLGVAKNDSFIIDLEGNILNAKGEIAALVHQYDRHKNIEIIVLKKFCNDLMKKKYFFYFCIYIDVFINIFI